MVYFHQSNGTTDLWCDATESLAWLSIGNAIARSSMVARPATNRSGRQPNVSRPFVFPRAVRSQAAGLVPRSGCLLRLQCWNWYVFVTSISPNGSIDRKYGRLWRHEESISNAPTILSFYIPFVTGFCLFHKAFYFTHLNPLRPVHVQSSVFPSKLEFGMHPFNCFFKFL